MSELLLFLTGHVEQFRRNRLAALYSDFRHLRTSNPDGYAANVEAWRKGLAAATRGGYISSQGKPADRLVLKVDDELLRALETQEWGRPLALGTVVRDAILTKDMIPLHDFLVARESIYRKSWTVTPWTIVSWGLKQLGLTGVLNGEDEDKLPVGKLVILSNLEYAAKELGERFRRKTTRTERIFSKKLFCEEFSDILRDKSTMSDTDLDVLLKFMAREKGMLTYNGQTIKLRGATETETITITHEDMTIASLKILIGDLQSQIDLLSSRVEALSVTAREAVSRNNRVAALAALRSKKLAESNFARKTATVAQLEEVYSKIGQAADQIELMRILEGSTGVLKSLNAEVGGVERVDEIVDQLQEQMSQVEEVNNLIAEVGQGGSINEDEVDVELKAMEREDMENTEKIERLEDQRKEQEQRAETRRKLEALESMEREAAQARLEAVQVSSTETQSINAGVDESAEKLQRISISEQQQAETAT